MKPIVAGLPLVALLAGCGEDYATFRAEKALEAEARIAMRRVARDPDSLEFRDVRVGAQRYAGQAVVCGYVNGRNGYGGMTGFRRFVLVGGSEPITEPVLPRQRELGLFDEIWRGGGC